MERFHKLSVALLAVSALALSITLLMILSPTSHAAEGEVVATPHYNATSIKCLNHGQARDEKAGSSSRSGTRRSGRTGN